MKYTSGHKECGVKITSGGSKTPESVMGNQGSSTSRPFDASLHNKSRTTEHHPFPGGMKSKKAASGPYNH